MTISRKRQHKLLSVTFEPLLPSQGQYTTIRHWLAMLSEVVKVPCPIYKRIMEISMNVSSRQKG